ncbi:MAG: hypothetical protein ACI4DW_00720 [Lachnospiraceae bacterium]
MKKEIIKEEIQRLIMHVKNNQSEQNGEETVDLLSLFKDSNDADDCISSYKKIYDVSIPIWQSTMDYLHIMAKEKNMLKVLEENGEDMVRVIQYIDDSRNEIIEALLRDNGEEMEDFRPSKVSGVLFDYSGGRPEYSFYVESNEEYHFHIYIRDDMSFDAGDIS